MSANPNPDYPSRAARALLTALRAASRIVEEDSGQTLVLAALCMVVLIGFVGLAVDGGNLRYQKRRLQAAADAAAIAGALELNACGAFNCALMQAAAQDALEENGFSGSSLLTNCGPKTGTRLELTISDPPCALSNDPNVGNSAYVEVVASEPVSTVFAKVLGINSVQISARAEATSTGGANCIYALNPSASGAIKVDSSATLTTTCGIIDESSSSSALTCTRGSISGTHITVAGSVYNVSCSITPAAVTNATVPTMPDPFSGLAKPPVPACGTTTKSPWRGSVQAVSVTGGSAVFYPGAYCGGISIAQAATATFEPGVYVLESKNGTKGLTVNIGSKVTGNGVTFYNYGPAGAINFTGTPYTGGVNLVAPTTGTYAGILFFQDPQNTSQATILGSPGLNTVLEGSYYFPSAKVMFAFSGNVDYNILVAYDIEFTSTSNTPDSTFRNDYSSLANGSPLGGTGAVVIQ